VLPKDVSVPDIVTADLDAVGIRVPAHPVALALIRAADLPVAAPSANRFTQLSPTSAEHVARGLGDRVDVLLDGGNAQVGIESTVVDLTGPVPRLLRPGMISRSTIEAVIGPLALDEAEPSGDEPRRSPGQVERHYAPRAALELLTRAQLEALTADREKAGHLGVVALGDLRLPAGLHVVRLPQDAEGYARELYAALHQLDDAGCVRIMVELPPDEPPWNAVNDRLRRAAR
jgi:L-threonylcarbamoyladenylate synthase